MLPVLTRYLTPEDYGIISIFGVFVSILSVFTGLSIHGAINVNFFKMQKNEIKIFIGNCLIVLNISTLLVLLIVYLLHPIIAERLALETEWLIVAVFLAFAQFLTTVNLLLWMVEQRPKPYSLYQISQTLMVTFLSLLFIVGFGLNWEGQLLATAIGTLIFSVISFVFIIKRGYLIFQPNKEHIKDALKFGVPLIPHALASWVKTGADRVVLMSILGATATGIYAVGYQIGIIISVLVTAFNKAWSPYMFNTLSNEPTKENKKKIVLFTYIYFVGVLLFAVCFAYVAELLIPYFLGKNFTASTDFILYFAVAFAFHGMYLMVGNYILYTKNTHILAYITFSTSVLHVGLLYVLVNKSDAIGAAQASVISFAVTFFAAWILASRVYKMPWGAWRV